MPYAIYQGDADAAVPVDLTRKERTTLCAAGSPVRYQEFHGVDHVGVVPIAEQAFPAWAADRFASAPAPSTCSAKK
jgi:Secretory lipase